ncbi:MAG: phospholipase D family protein [Methylobacter sp.]
MSILLHFQDPNYSNSYSLHEALINVCSFANGGKGAYAFASKTGADLFLADIEFEKMLNRGFYQLIVGIDEITNTSTIERLTEFQDKYHTLDINAFLHNSNNSLFHPKLSYFSRDDGCGTLIIGSGNLTAGGLRKNREAFAVINLSEQELVNIEVYWNEWLTQSHNYIKPLTDAGVLEKVATNILRTRARQDHPATPTLPIQIDEVAGSDIGTDESKEWSFQESNLVLLAEIPRSGDRWNQANFDVNTFETFFGATAGDNSQRILLRNVISDRNLGNIEVRPSVSVVSQNYRFELEAAAGLVYPNEGRPIGVFIRLSTRMFIYKLFMPEADEKYKEIADWINSNWTGRKDRMKRIVKPAGEIRELLQNSSLDSFLMEQQ